MDERKVVTLAALREQPVNREAWKVWWDTLESAPLPRDVIVSYIKAITHQPCSCTHCQTRKSTLLWAFPGIEKEIK